MQILSISADNTRTIAKDLIAKETNLNKPVVFLLYGDLGSGKTTFTKGIGEYLKIKKIVSPSFLANCEYDVLNNKIKKLIHFDFYNLKENEYDLIGLDEALIPGNVVVIEWPENNEKIIEKISKIGKIIEIKFKHINLNTRELSINCNHVG